MLPKVNRSIGKHSNLISLNISTASLSKLFWASPVIIVVHEIESFPGIHRNKFFESSTMPHGKSPMIIVLYITTLLSGNSSKTIFCIKN
ncbi:hypothetical protein LguiA_032538 [Lonicera macranthoides]